MMKYLGKNSYSTEKQKMVHFEMNLFFMKLHFYFNELYAVITT